MKISRRLHGIMDFLTSLHDFPYYKTELQRYNYLAQLLYEFDYYCSPSSVKSIRSVCSASSSTEKEPEVIEWKGVSESDLSASLHKPHLYQRFGCMYYVSLHTNSVVGSFLSVHSSPSI